MYSANVTVNHDRYGYTAKIENQNKDSLGSRHNRDLEMLGHDVRERLNQSYIKNCIIYAGENVEVEELGDLAKVVKSVVLRGEKEISVKIEEKTSSN